MYQQLTIIGNLGSDVEMRFTPSGDAVSSWRMAVNEKYGDKETVTWFKVSAWRKLAEITNQYLSKGSRVLVVGRVRASAYTGKDGNPAASLEVTANEVKFLSAKNEGPAPSAGGQSEPTNEDSIPF